MPLPPPPLPGRVEVRVHLFSTTSPFRVECYRGLKAKRTRTTDSASSGAVSRYPDFGDALSWSSSEFYLDPQTAAVTLTPKGSPATVTIGEKLYRGRLEITKDLWNGLSVVNVLEIEDYLKGVLPPEIGNRAENEFEAVKAQAVAARTYTLSKLNQYPGKNYDLEADTRDQVYGGVTIETDLTNRAIRKTHGRVALYGGRLINAYYHANCGGCTDSISRIWAKPQEDYLIPVEDSDFCRWSQTRLSEPNNYRWEERFPRSLLEHNFKTFLPPAYGKDTTGLLFIDGLAVKSRTTGGRVDSLLVIWNAARGFDSTVLVRDSIRWAFRRASDTTRILRSTKFEVSYVMDSSGLIDTVVVTGVGTGHGVGLCQTGAIELARRGYSYEKILQHYYPGIKIRRIY